MRYNDFKISDPVQELEKRLVRIGRGPLDINVIKRLITRVSAHHQIPKETLHSLFVKKHGHSPDAWINKIKQRNEQVSEDNQVTVFVLTVDGKPVVKFQTQQEANQAASELQKQYPAKKVVVQPTVTGKSMYESDEEPSDSDNLKKIQQFIEWTKQRLNINGNPQFTFSKDTAKAQEGHHTGVHSGDDIWVYIGNRNLIDILRTVFHELVHQRQEELNMIKPGDSYPGSPIEAMADMLAGKYIKIYGKEHPEIFQ